MSWEEWKRKIYQKYLLWQGRPAVLRKYIVKNAEKAVKKKIEDDSKIKVAAIQVGMRLYKDPLDFAAKMNDLVRRATRENVQLIVLPEENLTQLIGLLPNIENIDFAKDNSVMLSDIGQDIYINDVLTYIGPVIKSICLTTFSELARIYKVYIMTGSGLLPGKDKNIYNISYFFDPNGNLLGRQKKNHLLPLESNLGINVGDKLNVISTDIGKLAFPICMDATYFETFRIIKKKGAEIVTLPIADPESDYNHWTALRGIWGRVQESKVYGIKSAMVGSLFGIKFTGRSGIYAPLELTENKDGIIAEAKSFDKEEIVTAELDLKALRDLRTEINSNRSFWENYFPQVYYFL